MKPLVSVCIPAYNNAEYVKATVQAVLDQTYSNIEVIVVDDHSSDDTLAVLNSIQDERLHVFHNERNLGMSGNWNYCLSLANGEFVKLICADDLIDANAIERETEALIANPTAVLAESDTRLVNVKGEVHGKFKRYRKSGLVNGKLLAKKSLVWNNFFGAPVNNLIRADAIKKVGGFDTDFTYILDFDFWVSVAVLGDVYIIHEPLNSFCVRNDSNTGLLIGKKRDIYVAEHKQLLDKHTKSGNVALSGAAVAFSMFWRKFRNSMIGVYLKLFAGGKS